MSEKGKFVINNPFTGKPFEKAGDGTDMKGLVFETEKEANDFVAAHWPNGAVEMVPVRQN